MAECLAWRDVLQVRTALRAALICLAGPDETAPGLIAGRSAAACQLELSLFCGCDLVVVHGHGISAEAIELRHRAERAGVRFQTVTNARALIGAVGESDSLLVMQPGLWPEAEPALAALRTSGCVLVLPVGVGVQAGFERIDLDRAWAGALVLPGHLIEGLSGLPEDIAPAPALLRVALQHRLPEARLAAELLDDGSWSLLHSPEAAQRNERLWLRRIVGEGRGSGISARLAQLVLRVRGAKLAANSRDFVGLITGLAGAIGGALASAWYAHPALAFALLALAAPLAELNAGVARIRAAPFGTPGLWPHVRHLLDAAIAGCAVLTIEGLWQRALFAPLMLVAGLLLLDRRTISPVAEALRDRGVASLALTAMLLTLPPELAIMLMAAILIGANLVPLGYNRG